MILDSEGGADLSQSGLLTGAAFRFGSSSPDPGLFPEDILQEFFAPRRIKVDALGVQGGVEVL